MLAQSYKDFEIIFVDNNSADKSVAFVKSNFNDSRIIIISSAQNLGFAGGNNLGLKYAKGEFVVLLNNDTVVEKDWLKYLHELIITDESFGIVQSLVLTEGIPERYYLQNGTINLLGHNIMEIFPIDENDIGEIFQATGCSLIIRKALLDSLGGLFLSEYFAYAEDTFLCFKVKFFGKKIMHTSKSIVHHKGNATFNKQKSSAMYYYQERNRLLNFFLFFSKRFLIKFTPLLIFNFMLKLFASFVVTKYSSKGLIQAYFWLLSNYKQINLWRSDLNKIKRSDENIVLNFLSGKIFNGSNAFERFINRISLGYCRLVRLPVIENIKSR